MAEKKRLDILLKEKGYYPSRSKAKRAIMAGKILVNNELVDKAGTQIKVDADIRIKGDNNPYVSRGGLKLEKALGTFKVDPAGKEVIDVGASTGGFTDCLLQNNAKKVYAVDVGYGQIAWKLRQNKRVKVIEKTNFRYLTPEELSVTVPLIVIDVSFISLKLIIPAALQFLEGKGDIVALIKPQFEAGPDRIGKKGLVKNRQIHQDILWNLSQFFDEQGLYLKDLSFSPITGASSKNIEFLIHLQKIDSTNDFILWKKIIKKTTAEAHRKLDKNE
ncbi:MAG: TlyA family RNA methyltransferase [Bacillota bacterium]